MGERKPAEERKPADLGSAKLENKTSAVPAEAGGPVELRRKSGGGQIGAQPQLRASIVTTAGLMRGSRMPSASPERACSIWRSVAAPCCSKRSTPPSSHH
jgi:hypothetical protein